MEYFEGYQGQLENLVIVGFAMLLGGIIGFDRELAEKPAGLRTHMLVAGAAALIMILGTVIISDYSEDVGQNLVQSDPIRVLQAIVTGLSFLGAGTIIRDRSRGHVEGLTTAASILFAAGVGAVVAMRQYVLAVGTVLLVLITLRLIASMEQHLRRRPNERQE